MGIILGFLNSAAYVLQTTALQTISSSRSAFITGICVIIIPFIAPLFKLGKPRAIDILCAFICFTGLYLLTGSSLKNISIGDVWGILGAVIFAFSILYLQYCSLRVEHYKALTFYQIFFTAPFPLIFAWHTNWNNLLFPSVIAGILFCAIAATSVALYIQTKYQRYTTPAKAAVIYSLEPVFASVFAFLMNGEVITSHVMEGGLLIFVSLILPAIFSMLLSLRQKYS